MKEWTTRDQRELTMLWNGGADAKKIATLLDRSVMAIYARIRILGLSRPSKINEESPKKQKPARYKEPIDKTRLKWFIRDQEKYNQFLSTLKKKA